MSSLPTRLSRAPPSDSILPLHNPPSTSAGPPDLAATTSRPRPTGLRIPTWISTSAANSPVAGPPTPLTPGGSRAPVAGGRRRAHTVSVSFSRPQGRGSVSEEQPLHGSSGLATHQEGQEDEAERGLSPGGTSSPERRRGSIMERIRDSIDSRDRRDSLSNNPVGFEVMRHDGSGRDDELGDDVVGLLDVIDPQVSTVNHLQNMTNGIFIPHLPALWSRRPEIILRSSADDVPKSTTTTTASAPATSRSRRSTTSRPRSSTVAALFPPSGSTAATPISPTGGSQRSTTAHALTTIPSAPTPLSPPPDTAPLPVKSEESPSSSTEGLTPLEEHDLDLHVRRVLKKTKREKAKELAKGTWVFLKTPIGIFVGIYGILVVFWGAALVLILATAIPMPSQWWRDYWVEICSQILTALFTITGVGLIPWRVQDTYRMVIIAKYKHRTRVLRKKKGLPPIEDPNDLPDPKDQADYIAVLTEKEQAELVYQQEKFAKSQTWYKPHATATHKAFPITWALWNTILMDGNSVFQVFLCGVMWGINYHVRPAWTTGSLIPLSFLCGIFAAVLIWQGGVRTKKVASVEDKLRQALGVPLAIALPKSADGTIITGANKSPIGLPTTYATSKPANGSAEGANGSGCANGMESPRDEKGSEASPANSATALEGKRDEEDEVILGTDKKVEVRSGRRSTVTFGQIENPLLREGELTKAEEGGTVGEGRTRGRGQTVGGLEGTRGDVLGDLEGIELEKVKTGFSS